MHEARSAKISCKVALLKLLLLASIWYLYLSWFWPESPTLKFKSQEARLEIREVTFEQPSTPLLWCPLPSLPSSCLAALVIPNSPCSFQDGTLHFFRILFVFSYLDSVSLLLPYLVYSLGIPLTSAKCHRLPSGEISIDLKESVREADVYIIKCFTLLSV